MLHKFQAAKRLIATCLVTLLLVTTTLTIFPAPARADVNACVTGCVGKVDVNVDGEGIGFAAGLAIGGVIASSSVHGLIVDGIASGGAALVHTLAVTAAPLAAVAAPALTAAAPIVVPVAATAAVGYGAYRLWENHQNNQEQPLE
jgi:hypothetical protein